MRRDFEIIRKLLIEVEGEEQVDLSQFTPDQILYHKAYMLETKLAEGPKVIYSGSKESEIPKAVHIRKLTKEGHDFLEAYRDENRWQKAKDWINQTGKILTIETLKKAIVKLFIE